MAQKRINRPKLIILQPRINTHLAQILAQGVRLKVAKQALEEGSAGLYKKTIRMQKKRINCFRCKHFYVTWDKNYPRGCRAMGFKSQNMPSIVVFNTSGTYCLRFEEKEDVDKNLP